MKKICLALVSVAMLTACNKGGNVKLENDTDKTLYAMGFMLGSNIQRLGLNEKELEALYKGLKHSALGTKAEVDLQSYQPKMQALFRERMAKVAEKEKSEGTKFLDDYMKKNPNAKKSGWMKKLEDMQRQAQQSQAQRGK